MTEISNEQQKTICEITMQTFDCKNIYSFASLLYLYIL